MRFPLLLICASLLATAIATAGAAEGSVWIEGRWENNGGQYQWRPGYWQTVPPAPVTVANHNAPTTPAPGSVWIEGRWAQGANGWVWVEGHYEQPPVSAPTCPPPQPQVVVVQQPRPTTTVVIGAGYGYHHSDSYGYGYHRPVCPPPVVHCAPRPVVCAPAPVVYARPAPAVRVNLPAPSLAFPTVKIGGHRLPLPPIPVFRHR